jgi:Tfp pilus assembly protein PilV
MSARPQPDSDSQLSSDNWYQGGFTLLEVMVACAVFFMVTFAILELVTQGLVAAKAIQKREPDPGIILASISLSNTLEEGSMSGTYEDVAPGMYPGHQWDALIAEVGSNGLFEVTVMTHNEKRRTQNPVLIKTLLWRPNSKPGSATRPSL